MEERIQYVDINDSPIGAGTRENAWSKGIAHRLVRVILRDDEGLILIQQRSSTKKSYPNRWTDSASGHVDEGEEYEEAIKREMFEEIGVETNLRFLGKFLLVGHQNGIDVPVFNGVFEGSIGNNEKINPSEDEVAEIKWVKLDSLKQSMAKKPELFTPGFIETITRFY